MIKSFNCRETERIFNGMRSKKFPTDIQKRAFIYYIIYNNKEVLNV